MKVKEESEKVGLKRNIQKTKIMASGPIISWQIDGEIVTDFIFLGSKITADGHMKLRHLILERKELRNNEHKYQECGYFKSNTAFCLLAFSEAQVNCFFR